jgi:membrane peptidoglycan carboxypeptidase
MSLRRAMWASVNTVFTRLILDVGVAETMDRARALGLRSVRQFDPAVHGASIALGTEDVSPLDMASAYGVFAARGVRAEPVPVLRVTDREGNVLIDNAEPGTERSSPEEVADNVTDVLTGVLASGTASGRGIERPAAGKTGTTQNSRDAWFVGFTPTLSTAVWMGYENATAETTKVLTNIKGVRAVTGGSHPARIWQAFMRRALADVPVTEFSEPAPIRAVADEVKRMARRGFEPGPAHAALGVGDGGPYVVDMARPRWRHRPPPRPSRPPPPSRGRHHHHGGPAAAGRRALRAALTGAPTARRSWLSQPGWPSGQRTTWAQALRTGTPKNTASGEKPSGA